MISFYVKEAFISLKKAKFSSFVTIVTICLSIFLVSVTASTLFLSNNVKRTLIGKFRINVFLNDLTTNSQKNIISSILKKDKRIASFKFINKQEAVKEFIKNTGEDFRGLLVNNPLPSSFRIKLSSNINYNDVTSLVKNISKIKGVQDVVYNEGLLFKILQIIESVRIILVVITILSVILSVYLVYMINKLIYNSRRQIFETMKLVGAKIKNIKTPLYLNSIILGFISVIITSIGFTILILLFHKVYAVFRFGKIFVLFNAGILFIGLFISLLGSFFAARNIDLKI